MMFIALRRPAAYHSAAVRLGLPPVHWCADLHHDEGPICGQLSTSMSFLSSLFFFSRGYTPPSQVKAESNLTYLAKNSHNPRPSLSSARHAPSRFRPRLSTADALISPHGLPSFHCAQSCSPFSPSIGSAHSRPNSGRTVPLALSPHLVQAALH